MSKISNNYTEKEFKTQIIGYVKETFFDGVGYRTRLIPQTREDQTSISEI